jgi:hypothetical protein
MPVVARHIHVQHATAPNLPEAYTDAINGLAISATSGSCGAAVFRCEPVITTDI